MTDDVKIYRPVAEASGQQTEKQANNEQQSFGDSSLEQRREAIDQKVAEMPTEYGGRPADKGLEPTRYNDWELKGRCIDF